jgi:hypothetical protein
MRSPRVAYVPYAPDLSGPADRRRFCRFARLAGISFEVWRPTEHYDVVVVSTLGDLPYWSSTPKGRPKIVFDLPDSYLEIPPYEPRALVRGIGKWALRQHSALELSYQRSLERMCARAEIVLCSTPEQREKILHHNPNVFPILDFQSEAVLRRKTRYSLGRPLRLMWEGLGGSVPTLRAAAHFLRLLPRRRDFELHLVTDPTYRPLNGPVPSVSTLRQAQRLLPGVTLRLHRWSPATLADVASYSDIGIIPMHLDRPLFRAKAENKLLLLWRLGLPVITSAIPAYQRAMSGAGLDLTAETDTDWHRHLDELLSSEHRRRQAAYRGRIHAEAEYGEDVLFQKWQHAWATLGFGPGGTA